MTKISQQDKRIKSKLLSILMGLDEPLLHQFQRQILLEGSPQRDMVLIFKYLLRYHPNFDRKELSQTYAYQKIFKEPFNYARLMKGISKVYKRLNQFLITKELETNTFYQEFLLAKAYNRYNLLAPFEALITKKTDLSNAESTINDGLVQLQWNHLAYFSGVTTKTRTDSTPIKKASDALDAYFIGIKLRHLCELASRKPFSLKHSEEDFGAFILNYCQNKPAALSKLHSLYWLAYQLITQKKQPIYKQLKQNYWESWCILGKEDQVALLTYLMNFSAGEIKKNNTEYIEEIFQLYQSGIEKQILIVNKLFIEDHFVNLIYIASYLKKFDWIYQLLDQLEGQIINCLSPSVFNLAMARLTFAQQLYQTCQDHLLAIDYSIFIYAFRAKALEIACAFELNESVVRIESLCKAYENYLRKNKVQYKTHSIGGLNFIYVVRQLKKINPQKEKLKQKLNNFEYISSSKWLLEKINELK